MRDDIKWFFAWTGVNGYVTTVCSRYRRNLIEKVERLQSTSWRKIYRNGGRAVKCRVTPIRKSPL